MDVTTDRWFTFRVPPDAVWAALHETERYARWWPWLARFDADGLYAGAVWHCAVRSPVGTTLRFRLLIDTAGDGIVAARLAGDLAGTARIELRRATSGRSFVRLAARVRPSARPLATLTRLAPSVARWSHDRIVDTAARQFAEALQPAGSHGADAAGRG